MYGGQGGPGGTATSHGNGQFGQQHTVEVLMIDGSFFKDHPTAQDPPNKGGKNAVAMMESDGLWLDFDAPAEQAYFNVQVDIALAQSPCEDSDPAKMEAPVFKLTLKDRDQSDGIIESKNITGEAPPNRWTFKWATRQASFHKGASTRLRIDFHTYNWYAAIDNVRIFTTTTSAPTVAPTDSPTPGPTRSPTPVPEISPPGSGGDPHFTTLNGTKYEFHGGCDLVLLQNPLFGGGLGMSIHLRTKINTWWSYIESAVVAFGDETLEVSGGANDGGSYWVNHEQGGEMEDKGTFSLAGFQVKVKKISFKQTMYRIQLANGDAVSIQTYKKFVRVTVKAKSSDNFKGSRGLLGAFPTGEMLARDGTTIIDDDANAFGKEWQVLASEPMLFHAIDLDDVQHPEGCAMPDSSNTREKRRRLGEVLISEEDAKMACARVIEVDRAACIFDVLATNDKDMAGSY